MGTESVTLELLLDLNHSWWGSGHVECQETNLSQTNQMDFSLQSLVILLIRDEYTGPEKFLCS